MPNKYGVMPKNKLGHLIACQQTRGRVDLLPSQEPHSQQSQIGKLEGTLIRRKGHWQVGSGADDTSARQKRYRWAESDIGKQRGMPASEKKLPGWEAAQEIQQETQNGQ
jgi:hypothetical protein